MFTPDLLKGRTILVTGGGSGLGLSMARRFASLGATVAICGRSREKLDGAIAASGDLSDHLHPFVCDVRDYDAVGAMVRDIVTRCGGIDSLVNNAAGNFLAASEDLSANAFRTVIDIVLHGTFNCTQQVGRYLIEQKQSGAVLNIVTTYTETGSAFVLPSACAKAGVYALTTSLAFEWATYGIRVNAIAPGPFPTEGAWKRLVPDPRIEQAFMKKVPLGRFGTQEELSDLAAYLLSDGASFITGECVTIDGGARLGSGQFNFVADLMPREQLRKQFQQLKPKKDIPL